MKLRNKKTGGLATLEVYDECYTVRTDAGWQDYDSLKELNEEWEDYEEPKEYYFIDFDGDIQKCIPPFCVEIDEKRKQIGNYFETKEEAEKAVEKLKAWKRLKDKGFKFECAEKYENLCGNGFEIPITATMTPEAYTDVEVSKDIDLLFGGEE